MPYINMNFMVLRCFILGLIGSVGVSCSVVSHVASEPSTSDALDSAIADTIPNNRVVALGRLQPEGEVIKLSVPNAADSRVNQILVKEGDLVEAGQTIAILQGFERRQRDLEEAQKNVDLFQARLNQLLAGESKVAEIAAQESNIARLMNGRRRSPMQKPPCGKLNSPTVATLIWLLKGPLVRKL